MEKFTPYDKLSKKEQKRLDSAKHRDWEGLNPVTRAVKTSTKQDTRRTYDYSERKI